MKATEADYSRYSWQGERVRLRPLRSDDAEQSFLNSLDSPSRQLLQLGIELPSSVELARASLVKYVGCNDADGVIVFAIENLDGTYVGGISFHSRHQKNGTFGFGIVVHRAHPARAMPWTPFGSCCAMPSGSAATKNATRPACTPTRLRSRSTKSWFRARRPAQETGIPQWRTPRRDAVWPDLPRARRAGEALTRTRADESRLCQTRRNEMKLVHQARDASLV